MSYLLTFLAGMLFCIACVLGLRGDPGSVVYLIATGAVIGIAHWARK